MQNHDSVRCVSVFFHRRPGDCECCGGYDDLHAKVHIDHKLVLDAFQDGHFGGGNWDGRASSIYAWILSMLGYSLLFKGDFPEVNWYAPQASSQGLADWLGPIPKADGPLSPVVVELISEMRQEPDGDDYRELVEVQVPAVGTAPFKSFRTADNWRSMNFDDIFVYVLGGLCHFNGEGVD